MRTSFYFVFIVADIALKMSLLLTHMQNKCCKKREDTLKMIPTILATMNSNAAAHFSLQMFWPLPLHSFHLPSFFIFLCLCAGSSCGVRFSDSPSILLWTNISGMPLGNFFQFFRINLYVKGHLYCDIIVNITSKCSAKTLFWLSFNATTQKQMGRVWKYFTFG